MFFLNYLPNFKELHILETQANFSNIIENTSLGKLETVNCNTICIEKLKIRNIRDFDIEYNAFDSTLNLKRIEVSENIISDDDKELLNKKVVSVTIIPDN